MADAQAADRQFDGIGQLVLEQAHELLGSAVDPDEDPAHAHRHAENRAEADVGGPADSRRRVDFDSPLEEDGGFDPIGRRWRVDESRQQNDPDATAGTDANGDGIVDLIETEVVSGTTMVPLSAEPADLKIAADTYPKASDTGSYSYRQSVPLDKLRQAFAGKFGGQELMLERRVVYIHGVAPATTLPESVASLGTVPAQVTLPIACGRIELAD